MVWLMLDTPELAGLLAKIVTPFGGQRALGLRWKSLTAERTEDTEKGENECRR
jgi:hypothetical protein